MSEEIKTNDELIAEFMGNVTTDPKEWVKGDLRFVDKYEYSTSWDYWLMPVVEKIEGMDYCSTFIMFQSCTIRANLNDLENIKAFEVRGEKTKIDAVYKAVVEFIKWYNQRQNP